MITAVQACSRVHNGLTEPGQAAREGGEDNEVQVLGPPRWDNSLRVRHGKKNVGAEKPKDWSQNTEVR